MIASAWRLILHSLGELRINGLGDRNAATQLRHDSDLRGRYLVLYDMVGKLVEIGQSKFNVLATTTRKSSSPLHFYFSAEMRTYQLSTLSTLNLTSTLPPMNLTRYLTTMLWNTRANPSWIAS